MTEQRCPWKIRWTFGTDAQCELPEHVTDVRISQRRDGRFSVTYRGRPDRDEQHEAHVGPHRAVLSWGPGDRREFTGHWPGPCIRAQGCTLHTGHHGRCAP